MIPDPLFRVLLAHGYVGETTVTTPNVSTLSQALIAAETSSVSPGTVWTAANSWEASAQNLYHTTLPGDLRRAAPEIYRTLRGEGCASTRQWLRENYTGYKGAAGPWEELWSLASQVDFALSPCRTDQEMLQVLGTDDRVEVALRHLGAHFYEARTKDRVGAAQMRAFSTPGSSRDIVPSWMVSEASTFSKTEHQRSERVESEIRRRNYVEKAGGKDAKGKGKGKEDKTGK